LLLYNGKCKTRCGFAGFAARQGRATLSAAKLRGERFENITLTLVREAPAECEARLCRLSEAVSEARKAPSATPRCKLSAVLSSLNVS
jgi:hypothetical protein